MAVVGLFGYCYIGRNGGAHRDFFEENINPIEETYGSRTLLLAIFTFQIVCVSIIHLIAAKPIVVVKFVDGVQLERDDDEKREEIAA